MRQTAFYSGARNTVADTIGRQGALRLEKLQRLVIDASHIDQKKMGIMEIKDTMLALARLLARPELQDRYGAGEDKGLSLLFY